jgi:hypothetical protein
MGGLSTVIRFLDGEDISGGRALSVRSIGGL